MKEDLTQIQLQSQLYYCIETGVFTWKINKGRLAKKGNVAGTIHPNGYVYIVIKVITYAAHRLAWFYVNNSWPKNHIDHKNAIKTDNRIINIRQATRKENMRNRGIPENNTSGFVGVHFNKLQGNFTAQCRANGKKKHLGTFPSAEDASNAYQAYVRKEYREFFRETV
jgi:hypothetical protein